MPAAWSSSKRSRRTNSRSTARRNASVTRAVSCAGHDTNVPSGRNPPSVTRRWRCGCQLAREPCVWRQATIPTARSRSPLSVRIGAVRVHAATRAISPSRRRRYRQDARSRFGIVSTTCRCGTGASSVVSSHWAQMARRLAWQLGQTYRPLQENASRYSWAQAVVARDALVVHRLQAVELILHQPEQRRRLRAPGLVDVEGRRRRVCRGVCHVPHARSPTVERRAYGRPARGLSSWCCVAGHSDATCAGLTRLAAAERTTDRRAERHPSVRPRPEEGIC